MVYTKNDIRKELYYGVGRGYTHMIIICDRWDYEDFTVYVKEGENIENVLSKYQKPNTLFSVQEIYNYQMNLENQLNEGRAYHIDLDERTKENKIKEYRNNSELIDLHTHSCYSDGEFEPNELLRLAIKNGIKTISITDHDTLLGNKKMDMKKSETEFIDIIPGIELTAKTDIGRMHILGYGFDLDDKKLNSKIKDIHMNNINSILAMVHYLTKDEGITFDPNDIATLITTENNIGRPDLARLLVKYKIVKDRQEAFDLYLKNVYEKIRGTTKTLSPEECIELIKWAGGIPILAHPHTLNRNDKDLLILIKELVSMGLMGLEAYHSNNTKEQEEYYMRIVQDMGLLYSGGSDYHGPTVKPSIELGTGKNNLKIKELSVVNYLSRKK